MNVVKAVLLFTLVWTFSAVCQADDDFSVSCDDVTGSVGKEVTFTCRVSLQRTDCCIKMYKFLYPERVNDSVICRQELSDDSCDQRHIFTCSYTPATAMTQPFRFFVQAPCRDKRTKFTVNITDKAPKIANPEFAKSKGTSSKSAITAAVSCSSIVLIIIIMTIICKTKPNFTKPCGFQKRMFLCIKHDEENSTPPEDSAEQVLM